MSDLLVSAVAGNNSGNNIVASYSADGRGWVVTEIAPSSKTSPAMAVLNGKLSLAYQASDNTDLLVAGLANWGVNSSVGQSSKLSPAMATVGGNLWLGYIGEATGHVEVVSSSNGSGWGSKTDTGHSSDSTPALTEWKGELWAAFRGTDDAIYVASATNWGNKIATGQSSKAAPAVAVFNGDLWVAYLGETAGDVELTSYDGSGWTAQPKTGQTSKLAPALTVFSSKLWVGYVGEGSGHVELVSTGTPIQWSEKLDTGQAAESAPALAVIAAADAPSPLGGSSQYVFAGPQPVGSYVALQNIGVRITITEDIKVSPLSGLSPSQLTAQPIGFQINGFSQRGDKTICWQQYGVSMSPGSNQLIAFAECWPQSLNTNPKAANVFNLRSGNTVTLPDFLTIPAGWTITFAFQQQGDGTIAGFNCTVFDGAGQQVGSDLNIGLLGGPLAAGNNQTIQQKDLAKMVAFQVVLVGWANLAQATLTQGAGTIVCSSTTTMTAGTSWPPDSDGHNGTGEDTNSSYSLVPAEGSTFISQNFGVSGGESAVQNLGPTTLEMLVVESDGSIWAGASQDGVNWWHSHLRTPGFVKTGHSTHGAASLLAMSNSFRLAMTGQDNNELFWRDSSDGVSWAGGSIGSYESAFAPSLMLYYAPDSSTVAPWAAFIASDGTGEILICYGNGASGWTEATAIHQSSKCMPAFSGMIDYYIMLFVANDSSNRLLACQTQVTGASSYGWSGANDTGQSSPQAPSLAGLLNNMWMAFLSNDGSGNLLVCSSADGINWSGATNTGHQSRTAPCLRNCGGMLFMVFVGAGDGLVRIASSPNGTLWSDSAPVAGLSSAFTPAIASYTFPLSFAL